MDSIFSRGKDLWVLPDIENSPWRWTLEWSVNFQISKSLNHSSPSLTPAALEIFKNWEASEYIQNPQTSSPWVMLSVENLLPAKWLIYSRSITEKELTRSLDVVWKGLSSPSTRFFPSKTWTTQALQGLKSECAHSTTTEVMGAKES